MNLKLRIKSSNNKTVYFIVWTNEKRVYSVPTGHFIFIILNFLFFFFPSVS